MATRAQTPPAERAAPRTMRAAIADWYGPPEVVHVAEVPRPDPAAGEVLVHVHTAVVTAGDARP